MNIAFDVDGVIFPIEDFQIIEGKKYFKEKSVYDIDGYGIKEIFNCTEKEEIRFWIKNTFKFNRNVIVTEGINEIINKLRNQGHSIYILTARAKANENNLIGSIMRRELENALKRNNIKVDGIIYTSTYRSEIDKRNAIERYNIHIMVEDKISNIENIKDITNTICFVTRNNKDYFDKKVHKCFNSQDLDKTITHIINGYNKSTVELLNYQTINKMSLEEKRKYFEQLKQNYYISRNPLEMEKGENGCKKIVGRMKKIYNFMFKPKVIHKERFPNSGGVILAANHLHAFDPLLIMSHSNITFHLLAKQELLDNKVWNKLFTTIGSVFVDNDNPESRKKAKEDMIMTLLNDGVIMMFPEGTRNKTEKRLLDFHMGTVNIAQITGCPIYPCAINADYKIFKNNLCVSFGEPMYIEPGDDLIEKNKELKQHIELLLNEVDYYESENRLKIVDYRSIK